MNKIGKGNKKCDVCKKSDVDLVMPKMSQELLGHEFRILSQIWRYVGNLGYLYYLGQ